MGKIILAFVNPESGESYIDDMELDFVLPLDTEINDIKADGYYRNFKVSLHYFDKENKTLNCVAYPIEY